MSIPSVVIEVPGLQGPPGPPGAGLTVTARHDVDENYAYLGVAPVGTEESDEAWVITRVNLLSPVGQMARASGAAWNNRLSEVYE